MKILDAPQIRQLDAYTIANEPISSIDLMERAARQCFLRIKKLLRPGMDIKIFCGMGNNGGDGLAIARMLAGSGHSVSVFKVIHTKKASPDFLINEDRLKKVRKSKIIEIKEDKDFHEISKNDLIIDALFGTGLNRPLKGLPARVVQHMNQSEAFVVSIDLPSGLFCEDNRRNDYKKVVRAKLTLTFQLPKLALLLPGNAPFSGHWEMLDIGLHPNAIEAVETRNYYLQAEDIRSFYKPRQRFDHKGHFGHALLLAGSYGKAGSAVLAARAALRTGAGLLTVHLPSGLVPIMQTSLAEAMCVADEAHSIITHPGDVSAYNAIAIGPGLGKDPQTANALKFLIQNTPNPMVLDADALNILAENPTWLSFLPGGSVLTPHPKEFERLAGKYADDYERLEIARAFSLKYQVYLVLKGAHTAVICPDGRIFFNATGNPGMATAGSGDVLTGIILGFMAQRYTPIQSALAGVFIHGLAGDLAASRFGYESLIAGDIVSNLPKAIKKVFHS
ncbi:MAG: NAD(P)H-hydrate dehydratase [Bacteroides sp.]|jgi:NAD(P)H-hydrate epimerase|nr:NAD(P)H-hydrate dehydratase [Bacteroides sp.]